jgi:hypothetical protein
MIRRIALLFLAAAFAAAAANPPDFSGTWVFNAGKSKNIGMMASAEYTSTITQSGKVLMVSDATVFSGQKQTHETRYDLSGATVPNDSPMGEKSQTSSKWMGNKLVTSWESEGAVRGRKLFEQRRAICQTTERLCFWNRRVLARNQWSSSSTGSDERGRSDSIGGHSSRRRS